jgi:hypothetical protein
VGKTDVISRPGSAAQEAPVVARKVIDLHVHMLGMGDSGKGCRLSKEFIVSPAFAAMLASLKTVPFEAGEEKIRETILCAVDTSEEVDNAVLLAMDGVYKNGKFMESESHFVVPNDCVIDMAQESKRVLLGASALFIWAPAGQQINPDDDRCIPFYVRLAREGIPLLCHSGNEFAVSPSDVGTGRYNDPRRLIRALDIGVKAIVAHCPSLSAGSGMQPDSGYFEDLMQMLQDAEAKRWELFADISAYCTPSRSAYIERILREIGDGRISPKRFLYGSDFPMPAVDINVFKRPLSPNEMLQHITGQGNLLDKHFRIMKQFGIRESIFTNACDVLRL